MLHADWGRPPFDGEGVFEGVDGALVGKGGFEGGFDFPVLDEVGDDGRGDWWHRGIFAWLFGSPAELEER